jgi:hypothetical protein
LFVVVGAAIALARWTVSLCGGAWRRSGAAGSGASGGGSGWASVKAASGGSSSELAITAGGGRRLSITTRRPAATMRPMIILAFTTSLRHNRSFNPRKNERKAEILVSPRRIASKSQLKVQGSKFKVRSSKVFRFQLSAFVISAFEA